MALLVQFLLRLAFGLALGMAITSSRQVTSGYFRNHLYVTLGLATLAALVATSLSSLVVGLAATAAVASYVGSVCWLYEKTVAGKVALLVVALVSLAGTIELTYDPLEVQDEQVVLQTIFPDTSGRRLPGGGHAPRRRRASHRNPR